MLKTAKPPDLKEQLAPLVADLLALKVSYKEVTGEDFGGAKPVEEKKKKEEQPAQPQREGPSKAELNKLKRKEAKLEKRAEAKAGDGADGAAGAADAPAGVAPVAGTVEGDEALAHLYGDSPLVCSKTMSDKAYRNIAELSEVRLERPLATRILSSNLPRLLLHFFSSLQDRAGQQVWIRGRLATRCALARLETHVPPASRRPNRLPRRQPRRGQGHLPAAAAADRHRASRHVSGARPYRSPTPI